MKNIKLFFHVIVTLYFVYSGSSNGKDKLPNSFYLHMIKNASVIAECKVVKLENKIDKYWSPFIEVTLNINQIVHGEFTNHIIKLNISKDNECDNIWYKPEFELDEEAICFLEKVGSYWSLIGGALGKVNTENNKLKGTEIPIIKFKQQIVDILTNKSNEIDFPDGEGSTGTEALDGEFNYTYPIVLRPKGNIFEYHINPSGALDKDGNQLSFNDVKDAIQRAIDSWNAVVHSYQIFSVSSTPYNGIRNSSDNIKTITFEEINTNGVAANGNDIVFSKGFTDGSFRPLRWNTNVTYPSTYSLYPSPYTGTHSNIGPVDLEDVAAHELGHIIGLAHVLSPYTMHTMFPTDYTVTNWWTKTWRRSMENGDKAGKVFYCPDFPSATSQSLPKLLLSAASITSFSGTFTVPAGYLLEISGGRTFKFSNGCSLVINGSLQLHGTSSLPITFISESGTSPNSWGSITLNGSGTAGTTLEFINFQYGTRLEAIGTSNITIRNCNITDSYDGIRFYGTSGTIQQNNISSNSLGHGIILDGSSSANTLENKVVKTSGSRSGVGILYTAGSGGYMWRNDIQGWNWGVGAIWSSSPHLRNISGASETRNNRIRNCDYGVMIYNNSYPVIGLSTPSVYACNSIYNNIKNVSLNQFYSTTSTLYSHVVWWGGTPSPSMFERGGGSLIDSSLWLTTDPWNGIAKPNVNSIPVAELNSPTNNNTSKDENTDHYFYGVELRAQKRYREAKDFFINYITKHPDEQAAFIELYNCFDNSTQTEIINFFKDQSGKGLKENELLLSYLYLKQNDFEKAKENNNYIIKNISDNMLVQRAKINNLYMHLYSDNNIEASISLFNDISTESKNPTSLELLLLRNDIELYAGIKGINLDHIFPKKKVSVLEPFKPGLYNNYPNPFNPITFIKYQISGKSFVTLKVFDILGNEIATLVNEIKDTGVYETGFNASQLASGVYIYRIQLTSPMGNYTLSKKMILTK